MSLKFIVKIPTTKADMNKNNSCNRIQNIDGIINPDVGLDVPVSKMASLKNLWFRGGYFLPCTMVSQEFFRAAPSETQHIRKSRGLASVTGQCSGKVTGNNKSIRLTIKTGAGP